ncbi:ribosomal L7Ae/L30e/S12e/Gadd45 family protein [Candidatus Woesearchaeota archaeon]|nr:ribosomal L7Ae/L30e/S12e/Gadd45 family protein [Candidatus Woesearchaeota archaeon]
MEKCDCTKTTVFCNCVERDIMDIKDALKANKLIVGTKRTVKALRKDELAQVFLASNCPEVLEEDVTHFSSFDSVPVEKLTITCDELGVLCKKPFLVSVVGILK